MVTYATINQLDDGVQTAEEAEQSLVVAAMQSSHGIECLLRLPIEVFTDHRFRAVASAIRRLIECGRGIDLTTVYEELKRSGDIGPDSTFETVADFTCLVNNQPALLPDEYADDVWSAYTQRAMNQLVYRLAIEVQRGNLEAVRYALDRERETLAGLSRGPAEQTDLPTGGLALLKMADVVPEQPQPLWPGYLWLGKIAVLDGDPGLGKSTLTLDLAARVSTGRAMPDGQSGIPYADVLLLSAEDGAADTIRPRLTAAGADLERIHLLTGSYEPNPEGGESVLHDFTIPLSLPILEQAILQTGARLVVIDPLMAFLNGSVNSYRDQDVRGALRPLAAIAERTGACMLIVRHLNKASGAQAIYRGGGSIGIIGAARSGLMVAPDPENPREERVLALTKSNLGRMSMPALRYRTIEADNGAPHIEWLGVSELTPDQLLSQRPNDEERSQTDEAADILRQELAFGPQRADDVKKHAHAQGISDKPLRNARERLGVLTRRSGFGPGSHVEWSLPSMDLTQSHRCPDTPIDAHSPIGASMNTKGIYDGEPQRDITPFQLDPDNCPVTGNKHVIAKLRTADGWLRCVECEAVTNQRASDYSAN